MDARVHIHTHTSNELLAEWGPVLIRVLDGVATREQDIDEACAHFDTMLERYSAIASFAIVEHGTPEPSPAVRRYSVERWTPYGARMINGVALLGLGFWAKAAISSTRALVGLMRGGMILGTSIREVFERLALELVGLDAEALTGVGEELRERLRTPPAAG